MDQIFPLGNCSAGMRLARPSKRTQINIAAGQSIEKLQADRNSYGGHSCVMLRWLFVGLYPACSLSHDGTRSTQMRRSAYARDISSDVQVNDVHALNVVAFTTQAIIKHIMMVISQAPP